MPAKQEQRAEINTFVQGLITEASPLNFPPNAEIDGENFELNRDGSRNRRLGMDLEADGIFRSTGILADSVDSAGISTHKWVEVAGNPSLEFIVIQLNNRLDFYDINKTSLTKDGFLGSVTISEFPSNIKYSLASVEGVLIIVAGVDTFAVVSYENGIFSYYLDRIRIRDLFGVEESDPRYEEDISYRGDIDAEHYYNLQNQSWGIPRRTRVTYRYTENVLRQVPNPNYNPADPNSPPYIWQYVPIERESFREQFADPVVSYLQHYDRAPSNGEAVWIGMQFTPGQYNGETQEMNDPYEMMFTRLFRESWGSEVKTSRGYYVIDALRRGQSRIVQFDNNKEKYPDINLDPITGGPVISPMVLPMDYTTGGPTCIAEFAGRIFYSGFTGEVIDGDKRSPNYTNYVFFTTLVKNKLDLGKCYQDGDPTGRETADLLDTDGGFLRISEAKNIHTMVNLGTSLIVIADNGVWRIDGGSDYGFSATNYRVEKITTFGGLSRNSAAVANNRLYYWAEDGIYTIGSNEFGDLTSESISVGSIQKFYESIPNTSKVRAEAIYDNISKKVRWVINYSNLFTGENITRELVLDTTIGAFNVNRLQQIEGNDVNIFGLFQTSPYITGVMEDLIFAGEEQVFSDEEPVTGTISAIISGTQATKYLLLRKVGGTIHYSFSLYRNIRFRDWESIDGVGVDAKGFILTGHQVVGDSAIKKQIPYLILHFLKTEGTVDADFVPMNQSGCLFRCQWNFSDTSNSHNWTPLMQGYRYRKPLLATSPMGEYDNGFEVITTKNKIRGSGRAFAMYFETEEGKDCRLLGWNITMTGNSIT